MFRHIKTAMRIGVLLTLASTAAHVWPVAKLAGHYAVTRFLNVEDAVIVAELKLRGLSEKDYENEIAAALKEGDPELARSIVDLASQTGHVVAPATVARVAEAEAFSISQTASEAWLGLTEGNADTPTALAGSFIADLTGVVDARDLFEEYMKGSEYDPLTVGLSVVGLGATAATYATAFQSAPVRAGVTLLKSLKKAGKLPKSLQKELTETLVGAIDMDEAALAMKQASNLDVSSLATTARKIVKPAALKRIEDVSTSLGKVATSRGYRATVQSLKAAGTMDDLRRMERLSDKFGKTYRAALRFINNAGGFSIRVAAFLAALVWQIVGALVWIIGLAIALVEAIRWTYRLVRRWSTASPPLASQES